MRLNHNLISLGIFKENTKVLDKQSIALGRISSGYKVNNASDGPNAIAQSERFRMQIRGLQMASRNVQDGVGMLQTAEGGLDNYTSMLQRTRELVVQGSTGTNSPQDINAINNEINQLVQGMNDIATGTEFNGVKLLNNKNVTDNSSPEILKMAAGANVGESIDIPLYNLENMGVKIDKYVIPLSAIDLNEKGVTVGSKTISGLDLSKAKKIDNSGQLTSVDDSDIIDLQGKIVGTLKSDENVFTPINLIDGAIDQTVDIRGKYGAIENRFSTSMDSLNEMSDRIQGADSSIRDSDIAEEMMEYAKDNILGEAGTAMMVQSNKIPQDVLRILENVKSR